MSTAENNLRIDYIEFSARDISRTKEFYSGLFGWKFEDYGPEYTSFQDGRIAGGFDASAGTGRSGALIVIYTTDIKAMQEKVTAAGGKIVKPIFEFPGGRRFHFTDPNGHELAVWTDK